VINNIIQKKGKWKDLIINKKWKIIVLLLWAVSQYMEAKGGRADFNAYFGTFSECLVQTIRMFFEQLKSMNKGYCISALLIIISGIVLAIKTGDKQHIRFVLFGAFNAFLVTTYEILLCAKVEPAYIKRFDVLYCMFFWLMLIEIMSIYTITKKFSAVRSLFLLFIIVIVFNCETNGKTYRESTVRQDLEPEVWYQINDDIIAQLQEADRNGVYEMTVFVPQFDGYSNWPYGTYAGYRFSEFAYAYGLTSNKISVVEMIATPDKNYLLNGALSQ
jgi:hypothetical protein